MIAGALTAFIAFAVLPSMFSTIDSSKSISFKAQCTAIVKAKLQDYVNGVAASGFTYVPSGFEYTKHRWRQFYSSCEMDPPAYSPGFREYVNDVYSSSASAIADNAGPGADTGLMARLKGFRLFTMIRHYNPRILTNGQPTRSCSTPQNYQFFRVGDALEVTITGMIRTTPDAANSGASQGAQKAKFGKLQDLPDATGTPTNPDGDGNPENNNPNPQLTCSVTQIIYPPTAMFRYYLGVDGKFRSYQAQLTASSTGVSGSDGKQAAMEAHFRSLWSTVSTPATFNDNVIANIKNIVIAPDNRSAYVHKPGSILRYTDCNDNYDSRVVEGITFNGVPDCNLGTVTEYSTDPNIEGIAVDFRNLETAGAVDYSDDIVYGLFNSGAGNVSGTTGSLRQGDTTITAGVMSWKNPTTQIASIPGLPRVRGIFLGQTFPVLATNEVPNLYVIDNTCYDPGGTSTESAWVYCVSIFNAADTNSSLDVGNLPIQVKSVSF